MKQRKRGRPILRLIENDLGTEELRNKKKIDATTEVPDLLLKRGLISDTEHAAALHFRWLYTLKFGIKNIIFSYTDTFREFSSRNHDEKWREKMEAEYDCLSNLLEKANSRQIIIDTCIFNRHPPFLNLPEARIKKNKSLKQLKTGLQILARECWLSNSILPTKKTSRINFKRQLQKALSN